MLVSLSLPPSCGGELTTIDKRIWMMEEGAMNHLSSSTWLLDITQYYKLSIVDLVLALLGHVLFEW